MEKIWPKIIMPIIIGVYATLFMKEYMHDNIEGAAISFGLLISSLTVQYTPRDERKERKDSSV